MRLIKYYLFCFTIIALIFSFNTIFAQTTYQSEMGALFSIMRNEDTFMRKLYGVGAEMFFTPVNTSDHPFAEAHFLERVGCVRLASLRYDLDYNNSDAEIGGPLYTGEIELMKSGIPVMIKVGYALGDYDIIYPDEAGDNYTDTAYSLGAGLFIRDGFLFGVDYSFYEQEFSYSNSDDLIFKDQEYKIYTKFVKEFIDGTAFNIEGGFKINEFDEPDYDGSNKTMEFAGDYYINNNFSIGGGIDLNTGDEIENEGTHFSIDINALVAKRFVINLEYKKFIADNTDEDNYDSYYAGLFIRF